MVDLVEKVALLRREIEHQKDDERYAARLARIGQKVEALAEAMTADDPAAPRRSARRGRTRPQPRLPQRGASEESLS